MNAARTRPLGLAGGLAVVTLAVSAALALDFTSEQTVLSKMHEVNQMEIAMGQMAMQKGHDDDVRDYGKMLIKDHQNLDRRVVERARKEDVALVPVPASTPDEERQAERHEQVQKELAAAQGEEFDRLFLSAMVEGHQEALQMLTLARAEVDDQDVRSLVNATIPVIEKHLKKAQKERGDD